MNNETLKTKINSNCLKKLGFHCESDNGCESNYRFNNLLICGNDIYGYVFDHNNQKVNSKNEIENEYFKLNNQKFITQTYFNDEEELKSFLIENENLPLFDGLGRSLIYQNGVFYHRDLGRIKYVDGFDFGHLYRYFKVAMINLTKNKY